MADFPQIEWIEVDGRMVPSTKPQHYKKGSSTETELTGHDNPLPVANYTQNDKGIWLPTSKDNPVPTQVTGSIVDYMHERDIDILAKSTKYIDLTIPDWAEYISVAAGVNSRADSIEGESQYTFSRAGGSGPTFAFTVAEMPIEYEWTEKRGWQSEKIAIKSSVFRFNVTSANESDITFNLTIATYGNVDKNNRTSLSII